MRAPLFSGHGRKGALSLLVVGFGFPVKPPETGRLTQLTRPVVPQARKNPRHGLAAATDVSGHSLHYHVPLTAASAKLAPASLSCSLSFMGFSGTRMTSMGSNFTPPATGAGAGTPKRRTVAVQSARALIPQPFNVCVCQP